MLIDVVFKSIKVDDRIRYGTQGKLLHYFIFEGPNEGMFRLKKKNTSQGAKMYWPQVYLLSIAHACSHTGETAKGCLMFSCSRSCGRQGG